MNAKKYNNLWLRFVYFFFSKLKYYFIDITSSIMITYL